MSDRHDGIAELLPVLAIAENRRGFERSLYRVSGHPGLWWRTLPGRGHTSGRSVGDIGRVRADGSIVAVLPDGKELIDLVRAAEIEQALAGCGVIVKQEIAPSAAQSSESVEPQPE